METIRIRDSNIFSTQYPIRDHPHFIWKWDTDRVDSFVTVFTDCFLREVDSCGSKYKVAWMLEPPTVNSDMYREMLQNYHKFDLVFTFDDRMLSIDHRFRFFSNGASWVWPNLRKVYDKTKMVSAIFSNKRFTEGHRLRHQIASLWGDRLDLMGSGYRPLENKIEGMIDYRYSVVVENCWDNCYFSEKLMDCFYTGAVPIYKGFSKSTEFFDGNGIITFDRADQLGPILDSIGEEDYVSRLDAIKANFVMADKYSDMEYFLWINGLKSLFDMDRVTA